MHISFSELQPSKQQISKMTICMFLGIWTLATAWSSAPGLHLLAVRCVGTSVLQSQSKEPLVHWKWESSACNHRVRPLAVLVLTALLMLAGLTWCDSLISFVISLFPPRVSGQSGVLWASFYDLTWVRCKELALPSPISVVLLRGTTAECLSKRITAWCCCYSVMQM